MGKEISKPSTPDLECSVVTYMKIFSTRDLQTLQCALCRCGDQIETAEHYLIHCTNYQEFRDNLIDAIDFNIFEYDIDILHMVMEI